MRWGGRGGARLDAGQRHLGHEGVPLGVWVGQDTVDDENVAGTVDGAYLAFVAMFAALRV